MKHIYQRIFYELYCITKKFNPDTAFYTASLMRALFFLNIIAVYGVVRFIFNDSFIPNRNIGIWIGIIIFFVNQIYFVATKRYKTIIKQYKEEGNTTIIGWIYIISAVSFFYFSSNIHS
jgi:mannose/fructose/N-acetylgalactosamine-specific phosphotransferase system component IIC